MNPQNLMPSKKISFPVFAFILSIVSLTTLSFANSDEKEANTTQENTNETNNTPEYKIPSFSVITNDPHYQTQIYGGSSTIISGDTVTTSNSYPQNQMDSDQINNNQNTNQPNQGTGNNNSNKDGFYFNVTGPSGSSMSMGASFGNSPDNAPVQKSTSQFINGSEPQINPSKEPQQEYSTLSN